jgi:hypothetical protein
MTAIGCPPRTISPRSKRRCRRRWTRPIRAIPNCATPPQGWRRQYGGFLRGGRRFIYGNFFPHEAGDDRPADNDWRHAPMMVCDGGHAFFGVEYDVEGRRFTHLGFNGYP